MRNAKKILVRSGAGIVAVAVVIALTGLLVAKAAAFNHTRRSAAEWLFGYLLGAPVRVDGDVEVNLWPRLKLKLHEISQESSDLSPWRFTGLTLTFGSYRRLMFDPSFDEVELEAGRVVSTGGGQSTQDEETGVALAAFLLTTPSVLVSDFHVTRRDPVNGWSVDIKVSRLKSAISDDGQQRHIELVGSVGHKDIQLSADFARKPYVAADGGGKYDARISVSGEHLKAELRGSASTAKFDRDLDLQIEASSFELGDVLDAFGLERTAEAGGMLSAHLVGDSLRLAMSSGRLDLKLSSGERIEITGAAENLWMGAGFDLDVSATAPDSAISQGPPSDLNNIQFTRLRGKLSGSIESFRLRDFYLQTTLFDQTVGEIGPIGVGALMRTPEGRLALRNVRLQAGPLERPWIRLTGSVGDAIRFRHVDLGGKLDLDLDFALGAEGGALDTLGRLTGDIAMTEKNGALAVTHLAAKVTGSDVWSMNFTRDSASQPEPSQATFSTSIQVASFSRLATLFGRKSKFNGPLSFDGRFLWSNTPAIDGTIAIGKSSFTVTLAGTSRNGRSFLSGKLSSSHIDADELFALATTKSTGKNRAASSDGVMLGLKVDFAVSPLTLFDADVQINAEKLRGSGETARAIDARVTLVKGRLSADPISVRYAGGRFQGAASIDAQQQPAAVRLEGSAAGWNLADLVTEKDAGFPVSGRLSVTFDLGANLAALTWAAQPWKGRLTLDVRDGQLGTSILDWAGLGFWRGLFSAPAMKGESVLRCVRAPLSVSGGSMRTAPVIELETDHVRIVGHGSMNIGQNRVNLYFEPRPLDDLAGDPTYPFVIKGRLADPVVEVRDTRSNSLARRYAVRSCQPGNRRASTTACRKFAESEVRRRTKLFGQERPKLNFTDFGSAEFTDYNWGFGSVARGAKTTTVRKRIYQEAIRTCLAGQAARY